MEECRLVAGWRHHARWIFIENTMDDVFTFKLVEHSVLSVRAGWLGCYHVAVVANVGRC